MSLLLRSLTLSTGWAFLQKLFCELINTEHYRNLRHNSHVINWQATVQSFPDPVLHVHCDKGVDTTTGRLEQEYLFIYLFIYL